MRTLIALLAGILAVAWIATPETAATPETDIPALAEAIAPLSANEIQATLHTPIPDDQLPPAFGDATAIDQDTSMMEASALGAAGSVSFSLAYTPGEGSTPEAQTPTRTSGPNQLYSTASITYLIFDEPLAPEKLTEFDKILRDSLGDQAAEARVQEITVAGQPAYLVSGETEINGIPIILDLVAVPVGKVAVVSMTMSGGAAVDRDALLNDAEALSLAAIDHLRIAIEQRGTPAG